MADKTFDLTKIGLPEGTHSIQMKLSGGNKRDSALSNAVEYTVAPQGETWVINETASLDIIETFSINFTSNETNYTSFGVQGANSLLQYDDTIVYRINYMPVTDYVWTNQAYRTVTFEEVPTGELLTWLQANAVKQ